jgi:hypothetical protein
MCGLNAYTKMLSKLPHTKSAQQITHIQKVHTKLDIYVFITEMYYM